MKSMQRAICYPRCFVALSMTGLSLLATIKVALVDGDQLQKAHVLLVIVDKNE